MRQKERDARWKVKYSEAKRTEGADPKDFKPVDLTVSIFGCKNHICIDRAHAQIWTSDAGAANAHDGARLSYLIRVRLDNHGWAFRHRIFLLMSEHIVRANAKRSAERSPVEHVFAHQKHCMDLLIRTICTGRARIKIGMANLAHIFPRLAWFERQSAPA